jgi:hypothetical protein
MPQAILIIGEDPELVDFSAPGVPPNMSAQTVMEGVGAATDRLKRLGHEVRVLLTKDAETVDALVSEALKERPYDVIVIGAGLRTLPPMLEQFEKLINVLREKAPRAKLAFNSRPEDSDKAALRWLAT